MTKQKVKQAELFTPTEMMDGDQKRDEFLEESIAAYLMYMQRISELDDMTSHKLQRECEDVAGHPSVNHTYRIETLASTVNNTYFMALKDCVDMRVFALINQGYDPDKQCTRYAHVTFPEAFVMARKTFKERFSAKYEGRANWITVRSKEELIG